MCVGGECVCGGRVCACGECVHVESVYMWRVCACGECVHAVREGGGVFGGSLMVWDMTYMYIHAHHQPKMLVSDDFYFMKKTIILGDLGSLSNISPLKQYRLVVSLCTSSLLAVSSS